MHTVAMSFARFVRTTNPYVVDAAIAVFVLVAVSLPFVLPRPGGAPGLLAYLLTAGTAIPLIWRRRVPFTVLVVVALATIAGKAVDAPGQPLAYGGLVALYTVAALGGRRQRWGALAATFPGVAAGVAFNTNRISEYFYTFLVFFTAYVLGRLSHARQERATALEDRALRAEREREFEADRAAVRERARIAREMHDVLSHAVSLMIVQAEAGPVAVRTAPHRAEAAFDAIAAAGRDAMVQLRGMLGLLRAEAGPRSPQPTLAQLRPLVDGVPAASLRVTGEQRPVSADVELAAYRIVQEALTNAVKHAAASTVDVHLGWSPAALTITVTDDGAGTGGPGGGHGLVGIRERAIACGGTARTGPDVGGRGFTVEVRLPFPA